MRALHVPGAQRNVLQQQLTSLLSQDYCVETENSQHASNNRSVNVMRSTVVEDLFCSLLEFTQLCNSYFQAF